MTDALVTLVPALATALLHFLWQGALVGLLAWLTLRSLRNASPHTRYAVACLALLACVLLPAWTLGRAWSNATPSPMVVAAATSAIDPALQAAPARMIRPSLPLPSGIALPWIVALWASGAGLLSLRMACGLLWVRRLCRDAHVDSGDRWQGCIERLAPLLGIGLTVVVRLVDEGDSPVSAGWWRPVVLLPAAIAARVPAELVEALIAHELAHIRRHDYLVNLLHGAVEALLFYHPAVWWLSHRIRVERELVADDLAARALGEPRRLALALSTLDQYAFDRHACARSPFHPPQYAQAAHGGHLMSRIQQLIRPDRRAVGSSLVLPLVGLAVAGVAFYAHARLAPPAAGFIHATPAEVAAQPLGIAAAMVATDAAPAVSPLPAPAAKPAASAVVAANDTDDDDDNDDHRPSYALVRKDRDGISMSGDMDDIDDIRAARRGIDGDFIWFRRDGKAWVVRDADAIAKARAAWQPAEALEAQMEALDARMKPHSERMEALGERMEALSDDDAFETPEARAATARMEALGEQMEALAERQEALAQRMADGNDAQRGQLGREMETLSAQQEALGTEMERHGAVIEGLSKRMEAQHEPMEALAREMEAASAPMEGIGKEMEALGAKIERQAKLADGQIRELIERAYANGMAQPAPNQQ